MKFRQQIYTIGEFVHLFDRTENSPYVARITKIIQLPEGFERFPFIEVEWYLKKENLPQLKQYIKYTDHFSVAEVFASGQHEFVYMESIKNRCFVLSNKEYE